jgi:hypothetical protein
MPIDLLDEVMLGQTHASVGPAASQPKYKGVSHGTEAYIVKEDRLEAYRQAD